MKPSRLALGGKFHLRVTLYMFLGIIYRKYTGVFEYDLTDTTEG
jgi:hypothetical protein